MFYVIHLPFASSVVGFDSDCTILCYQDRPQDCCSEAGSLACYGPLGPRNDVSKEAALASFGMERGVWGIGG